MDEELSPQECDDILSEIWQDEIANETDDMVQYLYERKPDDHLPS